MAAPLPTIPIDEIKERLCVHLGYVSVPDKVATAAWSSTVAGTLEVWLNAIDGIDESLSAARPDSMAQRIGEVYLNYPQHVHHLIKEGHRSLRAVAMFLDIPIYWDKYLKKSELLISDNDLSIYSVKHFM